MNEEEISQIDSLRGQAITLLKRLDQSTTDFELPRLPDALQLYQKKLADNNYHVLVVGEAKSGKSSFVNALIGRNVLPTNVKVTTSRVFLVHHSEEETYRLRFENDSFQEITAEDLARYGSQVVADLGGTPRLDSVLRWLEVDISVKYLPTSVNILDTPGLGSLYAPHAKITQKFVPLADGVIVVTNSRRTLIQPEIDFVKALLDATHHIFFIQTMIDLFSEDVWLDRKQRNEQLLRDHFGDVLKDIHIWPISNSDLMNAAQTGDEFSLDSSGYKELIDALQAFLFRAAGWSRCNKALTLANNSCTAGKQLLLGRLTSLEAAPSQKIAELQQSAARRKQQFEDEWGERGQQRRELESQIQRVAYKYRDDFKQQINTIELTKRQKIDTVKSIAEVNQVGATLDQETVKEIVDAWHFACRASYHQCIELVVPFIEASNTVLLEPEVGEPDLAPQFGSQIYYKSKVGAKISAAQKEFFSGQDHAVTTLLLVGYVFGVTTFPPLAILGVLGAAAWSAVKGWTTVSAAQFQEAHLGLNEHFTTTMRVVRNSFFQQNAVNDHRGLVDYYFETLLTKTKEEIKKIAEAKLADAENEIRRLNETAKLNEQQCQSELKLVQEHLNELNNLGHSIETTQAQLVSLME